MGQASDLGDLTERGKLCSETAELWVRTAGPRVLGISTWISAFTSRSNLTISWLQIRTWTSWAAAMLETPATGRGGGQVQTRFRAAGSCGSAP